MFLIYFFIFIFNSNQQSLELTTFSNFFTLKLTHADIGEPNPNLVAKTITKAIQFNLIIDNQVNRFGLYYTLGSLGSFRPVFKSPIDPKTEEESRDFQIKVISFFFFLSYMYMYF